ncbi:MAG: hypothetical protein ACLQGP_24410 [Isosphaeraceae bacterium]
MPLEDVPGTELKYHLITFDAEGRERPEAGGLASEEAVGELKKEPITDVFVFSHGWQGDVPAARKQYNRWIAAMAGCSADIERINAARGGAFRPLMIGVHWPSLAFGDEALGAGGGSFAAGMAEVDDVDAPPVDLDAEVESMIDAYAQRIADTPAAREALRVIFARAIDDVAPDQLPPDVIAACEVLDRESGMGSGGEAAEPDADRDSFDPEAVYSVVQEEDAVNFAGFGLGGLLALPRTLSFWKMKARANKFGEHGGHDLVKSLMEAAGPNVRFHLMGHSFGCVVVSSIVAGPGGRSSLPRPIDTLLLIQGALSLWSYCPEIPTAPGHAGYFYPILREGRVRGPIVTTQSEHDVAVGRWYPLAAGVKQQVNYHDALPKYGAVGSFGLCGLDERAHFDSLKAISDPYDFQPGQVYNLDSSHVIAEDQGMFVGAHSDFAHPEVGHAVWSAVLGASQSG